MLPQPAGASVTAVALLEAIGRGCGDGALTPEHLRSRLTSGQLQMVSATCAADCVPQPARAVGRARLCHLQYLTLDLFSLRACQCSGAHMLKDEYCSPAKIRNAPDGPQVDHQFPRAAQRCGPRTIRPLPMRQLHCHYHWHRRT